jgi:molybdate transport system substrate-binding protein
MFLSIRALLIAAVMLALQSGIAMAEGLTIFAASSLTESLAKVADAYKAKTGVAVTLSFGASPTLARQIEQGAPADIFFSADTDWMNYLQKKGYIAGGSRRDLLGNRLALIAAPGEATSITIMPHFDLSRALGSHKLALADPASVPAGKYGKAALTALGVWKSIANKVVPAENVRVALEYVARGEAAYGIVYASDAKIAPKVKLVGLFPPNTHPAIIYPVALTKTASPAAKDFLAFLGSPQARLIFKTAGFMVR